MGKKNSVVLSAAIDGFLTACKARKLSPHTISDYGLTLRRFLAHVGDIELSAIKPVQISAFLASYADRLSEKTLLNHHIGLAALWTWAARQAYVKSNIVHNVERPKPKKRVIVPFTEKQVRDLLGQAEVKKSRALHNRCVLLVLLDTGLRASEFCGLTFGDIDLTNRRLKVLGKGNKERLLPFSKRTAQALFEHLSSVDREKKPFRLLSRTSLSKYLQRLGKKAEVNDVHPHRFRHTFAVTYLRNGGDPYTLQTILGHSTLDMVKEYLALAQTDIETVHLRASPVENWQL